MAATFTAAQIWGPNQRDGNNISQRDTVEGLFRMTVRARSVERKVLCASVSKLDRIVNLLATKWI